MAVVDAERIRRRDSVPTGIRTEDRDAAADWIEKNVLAEDRWPMTLVDMAEESGWSRQHMKNVVETYFEPLGDSGHAEHLSEVIRNTYRQGFQDGVEVGRNLE